MIVTAGKTNKSVYFYIVQDAGNTSPGEPVKGLLFSDIETGGSASYMRQGAARVDFTLITLASASAAHADGGFILVDDTNMPGLYRCDVPDAAFATGVDQVVIQLVVAAANNAVVAPLMFDITDVDLRDSVRGGMTALPNAAADAAGGLPISDAGGLDLDGMNANVNDIETDTGTTLPTTLATIAGYIDTEIAALITNLATVDTVVDAIKVTTDKFVFTVANKVDCNAQYWLNNAIISPTVAGIPRVDIFSISTDVVAADNLEAQFDGTGLTGNTYPATQLVANAIQAAVITNAAGVDIAADIIAINAETVLIASYIDTEIAAILLDTGTTLEAQLVAIKAITDQMVFTKANELDVNTQSINGATVVGDGNATPWDGA